MRTRIDAAHAGNFVGTAFEALSSNAAAHPAPAANDDEPYPGAQWVLLRGQPHPDGFMRLVGKIDGLVPLYRIRRCRRDYSQDR